MNEKYIRELVKLTRVSSDKVLNATIEHMFHGLTQDEAAEKYGINQEAISRLKRRIKKVDAHVTLLHELKK